MRHSASQGFSNLSDKRVGDMIIFPSIDIRGGRVVRLKQGRADQQKVYFEDPAEPARLWKAAGAEWIHVVDLDGAFLGAPRNWEAIGEICRSGLKLEMGGGIRGREEVKRALAYGVDRVILGTSAARNPQMLEGLVNEFGERIAVGIDAREGKVAVRGWVGTAPVSPRELAAQVVALGVERIVYTDIRRDGMMEGPNIVAQESMLRKVPAQIIASGGVSGIEDIARLRQLSSRYGNLEGVIIGTALYEEKVDLREAILLAGAEG